MFLQELKFIKLIKTNIILLLVIPTASFWHVNI